MVFVLILWTYSEKQPAAWKSIGLRDARLSTSADIQMLELKPQILSTISRYLWKDSAGPTREASRCWR
jgi:hypothetical protein